MLAVKVVGDWRLGMKRKMVQKRRIQGKYPTPPFLQSNQEHPLSLKNIITMESQTDKNGGPTMKHINGGSAVFYGNDQDHFHYGNYPRCGGALHVTCMGFLGLNGSPCKDENRAACTKCRLRGTVWNLTGCYNWGSGNFLANMTGYCIPPKDKTRDEYFKEIVEWDRECYERKNYENTGWKEVVFEEVNYYYTIGRPEAFVYGKFENGGL